MNGLDKNTKPDDYIVIPNPIYNTENPELEDQMNAEDEYLTELIKRDNTISFFKQELEKTSEELEKISEKLEKTSEELEKERKLKEHQKQIIVELAKTLKETGVSIEIIMQKTMLTKE